MGPNLYYHHLNREVGKRGTLVRVIELPVPLVVFFETDERVLIFLSGLAAVIGGEEGQNEKAIECCQNIVEGSEWYRH